MDSWEATCPQVGPASFIGRNPSQATDLMVDHIESSVRYTEAAQVEAIQSSVRKITAYVGEMYLSLSEAGVPDAIIVQVITKWLEKESA